MINPILPDPGELGLPGRGLSPQVITTIAHRKGPASLMVVFVPANQAGETLLDGKSASPVAQRVERLDRELKVIRHSLPAGSTVTFTE